MAPDASRYVAGDSLRWGLLLRDSVGAVFVGYIFAVVDVVSAFYGAIETGLRGLSSWLSELVTAVVTVPLPGMRRAFGEAAGSLESFGIAGYVVAIGIVVITLLVFSETLVYLARWRWG